MCPACRCQRDPIAGAHDRNLLSVNCSLADAPLQSLQQVFDLFFGGIPYVP